MTNISNNKLSVKEIKKQVKAVSREQEEDAPIVRLTTKLPVSGKYVKQIEPNIYETEFADDTLIISGERFCACWETGLAHISEKTCDNCFGK